MKKLNNVLKNIIDKSRLSISRFYVSVIFMLAFTVFKMIEIQFESSFTNNTNIIVQSVILSLIFTIFLSMALSLLKEINLSKFKYVNLISMISFILTFFVIYRFGVFEIDNQLVIKNTAEVNIYILSFISVILFIFSMQYSKFITNLSDSLYIFTKAFFTTFLYGLVLYLGSYLVLGAFETLIYNDMSFKVYLHTNFLILFLVFLIFISNIVNFNQHDYVLEYSNISRVIFNKILTSIVLLLSVVLMLWILRILINSDSISFMQLSSIATSYIILGLFIYVMIYNFDEKLVKYYLAIYPFLGLIILLFQGYTLYKQIINVQFSYIEYNFLLLWIFGIFSITLIIFIKAKAFKPMTALAVLLLLVSISPVIGYSDAIYNVSLNNLETTLVENNMLVNNQIVKSHSDLDKKVKYQITVNVENLANSQKSLPDYLPEDIYYYDKFNNVFGFEKTYSFDDNGFISKMLNISSKNNFLDLKAYDLGVTINLYEREVENIELTNNGQKYNLVVDFTNSFDVTVSINQNNEVLIKEHLNVFFDDLFNKYASDESHIYVDGSEMQYKIVSDEIEVVFVFDYIERFFDEDLDQTHFNLTIILVKFT